MMDRTLNVPTNVGVAKVPVGVAKVPGGQVSAELNALSEQCDSLLNILNNLKQQLDKVLDPKEPEKCNSDKNIRASLCPLATSIRSQRDKVEEACSLVNSIIRDLEV